ncbi:MAG: oxygen-dependent tRNA uridine(34) hydroxylase TrhO [Chitinophagaceae bacterium]
MVLHNRVSSRELKRRLAQESTPRVTFSFYQYTPIPDTQVFRDEFYLGLHALEVFGRIYIAHEGVNGQVSVPISHFNDCRDFIYAYPGLKGIRLNIAVEDDGKSFWVLKIKIRDKIVADGIDDPAFNMAQKGQYLNAREFNQMADDPSTIIVDMRNHYEYEVGHFEQAIPIISDTFREQLPRAVELLQNKKDKNVIMYCTGGIRCEKASAYLLYKGFQKVFHLEGGIIEYAHQVKAGGLENKFKGKNFVFDNRLGEVITNDIISQCHQCGQSCDQHTNCLNDGCHLLFIQCETCAKQYNGCCSPECQKMHNLPPEDQKRLRKGKDQGQKIFNKSKDRLRPQLEFISTFQGMNGNKPVKKPKISS